MYNGRWYRLSLDGFIRLVATAAIIGSLWHMIIPAFVTGYKARCEKKTAVEAIQVPRP